MSQKTTRPLWAFDDSEIPDPLGHGERALKYFAALRHPLSDGKQPRFWQRVIRRIYGPRHPDGRRIVNRVFMMIPRGSRKTTNALAGMGLLHAAGWEKVPRGQVILASGSKDQAEFGLDEAKAIVAATPAMKKKILVRGEYLEHKESGSSMRLVSSAGDFQTGSTPAAVFIDEFQNFGESSRSLIRALRTGLVKRPDTFLCIVMNAGRGQLGPAWEEYCYAKKVTLGEIENKSYLPIILEPDSPHDDPFDENLWRYVNPLLDECNAPDIEGLRTALNEAKEKPGELDDLKQYCLGFWLESVVSAFVDMNVYDDAGTTETKIEDFRKDSKSPLAGCPVFLGVDLSSTIDLSCVSLVGKDANSDYIVKPYFFCPSANLEERQERTGAAYKDWVAAGHITATRAMGGLTIDFGAIEDTIRKCCAEYNVQDIAIDPHLAPNLISNLHKDGLPVSEHRQGSATMMMPTAETERAVVARKLKHFGHPVLRFCFANAQADRNRLGHIKYIVKPKRWLSIDGCTATIQAVGRAFHSPAPEPKPKSLFDDLDAIERLYGIKLDG